MDEQSGKSKKLMGEVSRKWRNWYQNKIDKEIEEVDSRDKIKHSERSDQLFLERMMTVFEQE